MIEWPPPTLPEEKGSASYNFGLDEPEPNWHFKEFDLNTSRRY